MKSYIHNVVERIKSMCEGRSYAVYNLAWDQIDVDINWLTLENERGQISFKWDSVSAVDTYKRDLFATDCICLAFETPEGWIEVNEDMKNWGDFVESISSSLPEFPPSKDWYTEVTHPAFVMNHKRLWTR